MRYLVLLTITVFLLFFTNQITEARTILSCKTTMDGHAYYHLGGLVTSKDAGWKKDKMSNYEIELVLVGDKADIIFKDRTGRSSATAEGGEVIISAGTEEFIHVVVISPLASELITFDIANNQLWLSAHQHSTPVNKSANFVGNCRY